jgi:hypothetical protein
MVLFGNTKNKKNMKIELNKANKKVKIFTSEDGVDMFAGDKYCYLTSDYNIKTDFLVTLKDEYTKKASGAFRFSTVEAAQKYLDSLKPEFNTYTVTLPEGATNIQITYKSKS